MRSLEICAQTKSPSPPPGRLFVCLAIASVLLTGPIWAILLQEQHTASSSSGTLGTWNAFVETHSTALEVCVPPFIGSWWNSSTINVSDPLLSIRSACRQQFTEVSTVWIECLSNLGRTIFVDLAPRVTVSFFLFFLGLCFGYVGLVQIGILAPSWYPLMHCAFQSICARLRVHYSSCTELYQIFKKYIVIVCVSKVKHGSINRADTFK